MNGVDLALGLLVAAAIALVVRWCATREMPWHRPRDGLAEMGRVIEAARAANDHLEDRASALQPVLAPRVHPTEPQQVARKSAKH